MVSLLSSSTLNYFYPRPPRGGRPAQTLVLVQVNVFLSTPSARRATIKFGGSPTKIHISIHALREEGDEPLRVPWPA